MTSVGLKFIFTAQGVMEPIHPDEAAMRFEVGQMYRLDPINERSEKSERHYFAMIREAWNNLPEDQARRFRTPEHLRKWALVHEGYFDERSYVCDSDDKAKEMAAFIRPLDEFAVVSVRGNVVRVFNAKSQSRKEMGAQMFQESKDKTLAYCQSLIGVTLDQLYENAGRSA